MTIIKTAKWLQFNGSFSMALFKVYSHNFWVLRQGQPHSLEFLWFHASPKIIIFQEAVIMTSLVPESCEC